jgi:predicted amidohydrolase YtcJ
LRHSIRIAAADLDAAFPERPVWLERIDGHAGWANTAAMRRVGRDLGGDWQPDGGQILRDGTKPAGVFVDKAADLALYGRFADEGRLARRGAATSRSLPTPSATAATARCSTITRRRSAMTQPVTTAGASSTRRSSRSPTSLGPKHGSADPRLGLYAAVARQDLAGEPPGGWLPDQRLTPLEALRGFTADAAWAGFMEREVGRLEPGLRADFVLLDADPLTAPSARLPKIRVLSTWVDGAPVFTAK